MTAFQLNFVVIFEAAITRPMMYDTELSIIFLIIVGGWLVNYYFLKVAELFAKRPTGMKPRFWRDDE